MQLIGRYSSPFVRRVAVTMQVYGIDYRRRDLVPFGDDKAEIRKHNPLGRVPALVLADGETLVESTVIIDYLDGVAGPERALTPPLGPARRQVLNLAAVAAGAAEKLTSSLYEHHLRPREMVYRPWTEMCDRQVSDGFQWLETRLAGNWFVGDRMSQADIAVAAFWQFGMEKRPNFLARMACPRIQGLSDRMAATPPFLNTLPGEGLPKGIALE